MAKVAIIFYSGSGNTEKMAGFVEEGLKNAGAEVEKHRADVVDVAAVADADAFAFGSPDYYSYMAGALKMFFDKALSLKEKLGGKPYVSFGSHGGGAKATASIDRLASALGMNQAAQSVQSLGAPSSSDAEKCRELGKKLAETLG